MSAAGAAAAVAGLLAAAGLLYAAALTVAMLPYLWRAIRRRWR